MALSLREKLQKASQASIATNAAKTIAKLATMEQAPASTGASLPEEPATDPATQSATHQATQSATQRPTRRPSQRPTKRPSDPVSDPPGDPLSDPATHQATQSATLAASDPVGDPVSDPQGDPVSDPVNTAGIKADVWETLTPIQRSVLTYLAHNQGDIVRYADIAGKCRIPVATAQTACRRFKALAFLSSQYGSRGCVKGVRFALDRKLFDRRKRQDDPEGDPLGDPVSDGGSDPVSDGGTRRPARQATHQATHQATQTPYKEDRQIENLSLSSERIALAWPHLARSGFGVEQVRQAVENLTALGKPADRVVQGLDHIEYELAHGQLCDKDGQTVADPCSWAFRALAQNGYYRRPKGYVSPAEQAALDAEVEARAVIAARQQAEQAQFEAWRDGLSADAMRAAMAGCPGGPKDAWLRKVWREKHHAR